MKTRIEQVWDEIAEELRTQPLGEGGFKIKQIDRASKFNVYAGVDSSGSVMLAVSVGLLPPAIRLESASLDYFRQQRHEGSWLMALRLRQLVLCGVFGRLCQDLVDSTESVSDETELVALFRDRLNLWRKLFDHGSGGQLQPHEIKGLIAELLVLEAILLSGGRDPLELVTAWVGPTGADQDFLFSDEAIEVKAVGPGSEGVSISSLEQLHALVPIRLSIQTLRQAALGEEGAIGLNRLVPRVEGVLAASPNALALFKGRLLEGGYVEGPHYDTILFQPMASEEFQVTKSFPKLIPSEVPKGVTAATYVLSLDILRNPG